MKTSIRFLSILLLGLMPFILWNCSDDDKDDNPNDYQSLIVGTWIEKDYPDYGIKFNSNGTYVGFGSGSWSGTYKIDGDNIILNEYDEYDEEYYNLIVTIIELNKSTLIVEEEGEICTYVRAD